MSRRSSKRTWNGPLPHKGDEIVATWDDEPAPAPATRSWMEWWPSDPAESDRWAAETLRIVEKVWRREGLTIYFGRRNQEIKEELHGYLIEKGLAIRESITYLPETSDPLDTWCAILYSTLRKNAAWYFAEVRGRAHLWDGSLDQLDQRYADTGHYVGRRALHGQPLETLDPERFWIVMESLERMEDPDGGAAKDPALCIEWACQEPVEGRRRCHRHFAAWTLIHLRGTCAVEECENSANQRGLCNAHYRELKLADPERPTCIEDDCDRPAITRSLCDTHYRARLRNGGTLPPRARVATEGTCSNDRCDKPVNALGQCKAHRAESRIAASPPCTEPGCDKPQLARGVCRMHYSRRRRAAEKAKAAA